MATSCDPVVLAGQQRRSVAIPCLAPFPFPPFKQASLRPTAPAMRFFPRAAGETVSVRVDRHGDDRREMG